MSDQPIPPYYNDLDATLAHALALISGGIKDRHSGMHTFAVGTLGADGAPRVRTVVNRGFDAATRAVRFHTDARAPKVQEIEANPSVAIHLYDAKAKIQLRLAAKATVHRQSSIRQAAWDATRDFSRICYRVVPAPGEAIDDPTSVAFTQGANPEEGEQNFVAVTAQINQLEWLYLAHQGHRRARFIWDAAGALQQTWLVP